MTGLLDKIVSYSFQELMTRLGYQIPNFTYPGIGPEGIFPAVVAQAKAAEAGGFDRLLLMDHLYQLHGIGSPDDYMLERYATLAALAQLTSTMRLSALSPATPTATGPFLRRPSPRWITSQTAGQRWP